MKTLVIAEAGSNHNGYYKQAISLIDAAIEAKCDVVKFQTFAADTLFSKFNSDFANYKDIKKILRDNEIPRWWQKDLKKYCDDHGIEFMSTPFDEAAVDELVQIGVKRLKIAGFEATDPRFIKLVAQTRLPLIISLGIRSTYENIEEIYSAVESVYPNPDITFLHCNNAYPTPYEDINLGTLSLIKNELGKFYSQPKFGLSDHTLGILIPPVAVALGARCIEKHFTLSNDLPGPDHHFAIEPVDLKKMVTNIRLVESALGVKADPLTLSEKDFNLGTRSVVAKRFIKVGEILTEDNITTKRSYPDGAVSSRDYYYVLGKKVNSNLQEDEVLKWQMI